MMPANLTASGTRGTETVPVGLRRLSIDDVVHVARGGQSVGALAPDVRQRMQATADWVAATVNEIARSRPGQRKPTAYYWINTGFGGQAGRSALDSEHLTRVLGRNLMASHSVGVGPYFEESAVRAALLIRAQSLAQGYSGVRPLVVETLLQMLNDGVYPAVPEQGSLGASGDLAPLAHLLLVFCQAPVALTGDCDLRLDTTDGEAFVPQAGPTVDSPWFCHVTEQYATGEQKIWRRVSSSFFSMS